MWGLVKKNRAECSRFLEALEEAPSADALAGTLAEHAASCEECREASDTVFASGALLKVLPREEEKARPWFAPRVMAAIAAREAELMRAVDTWTLLPKMAARLTWVTAFALLLTTTWLVGRPASTPTRPVLTDLAGDPVVETAPAPVNNDDVLVSLTEKTR
jgi:predicted anti-sigma-YlaC factor YlaD